MQKMTAIFFTILGLAGIGTGIYLIPEPHHIGFIMMNMFVLGLGCGIGISTRYNSDKQLSNI